MGKGEVNILFIGVIIVAVATIATLFYSVLYAPAPSVESYDFGAAEDFSGEERVLVSDTPETQQPFVIPAITITGFAIGTESKGVLNENSKFRFGQQITLKSQVSKFRQEPAGERYKYGIEQWIATKDQDGIYVDELTGMTANYTKIVDAPLGSMEVKNYVNSSFLQPGNYTIQVFFVDAITQDIDLEEKEIIIT